MLLLFKGGYYAKAALISKTARVRHPVIITIVHTTEQMGVVSSRFHRPYVHLTYIDILLNSHVGSLELRVVGNVRVECARVRLSRPLNYGYECAATIRGRLLFL